MRKLFAGIAAIIMLLVPCSALAEEETAARGELLSNSGFSQMADDGISPKNWEFDAYTPGVSEFFVLDDDTFGSYVLLVSQEVNDARLCQTVAVQPERVYRLAAMVCTEGVSGGTGASLSIDNYDIDGTYCYSENLHGTGGWQEVALYVRTGAEQTSLRVALRLGGYGTMALGEAGFSAVSLTAAAPADDSIIVDLPTENGTVSALDEEEEASLIPKTPGEFFLLMALVTLACAGAFAFLYIRVLRSEGGNIGKPKTEPARILALVLALAFLLRLLLSLVFYGHSTDMGCFMAWGNAALTGGLSNFYTSGMFADYPPGYMYVCAFLAWICKLLEIPYGHDAMAFLFKLPAIFADLVSAFFVYRIAKRSGISDTFALILAGVLAWNPVLLFVSGAWGQIDTLLTLLLVLCCYCFIGGKRILAGAIYGLAILLKPQALMLGPVLAAAYITGCIGKDWRKRTAETALSVLAAILVLFILSIPFQGTQTGLWLVSKYVSTASGYPYASVEAFNLAALLNGNWRPVDTPLLGLTYRIWGMAGIALATAFAIYVYCKGVKRNPGVLYLSGALMIVGVFTLGHFMHERYLIPALLLLLMAYIAYRDRRLLLAFGAVSVPALLNVMAAMYIVDHQDARTAVYRAITAFGSMLSVLGYAFLCYCAVRIVLQGSVLSPAAAPKRPAWLHAAFEERNKPLTLPKAGGNTKLQYTRRDFVYILSLTLVYGVVALSNLGTLHSPQTFYTFQEPGETVVVDFGGLRHIGAYEVFGNINNDGELLLFGQGGEATFQQTYDDMFRWKRTEVDIVSDTLALTLSTGRIKVNEVAFFDTDGNLLPVTLRGGTAEQLALIDEQDTVPEIPSYYNGMYFDELYHGRTAYEHLHNLAPYENSHPPLGKLFIMLGIAVFGMCPFGWRVVGALFGVGMLPILYAFSKRMFRNDSNYALLATTLFAFDFMHFTQTRIATIDVYAVFFILLMYYYMFQYMRMNFFTDGLKETLKPLCLAGVFFGVGAACKWTCIYAGGGLAVLLLISLLARYREYAHFSNAGTPAQKKQVAPYWNNVIHTLLACCIFYILVPVTIYFASYTPYYIYEAGQNPGYGFTGMCKTFWHYQDFMYSYHSGLNATHPYQSLWYTWPWTVKPMWYYFNNYSAGQFVSTLTASGNPAVWWVGSLGTVALLIGRITGRIKRDPALAIIAVGIIANYLPWVAVTRCTFIYHFFACVPFIILATVYLLQLAEERNRSFACVKWIWIVAALLFCILLYPGLSGLPVSNEWAAILHKLPGGKLMYGAG